MVLSIPQTNAAKTWIQNHLYFLAPFHLLVAMSVLSPKWRRRSNMWCDRQPGSQPSISANGNDLFAGLGGEVWGWGLWGAVARMILTGFACLPSCRREGGWRKGLRGNRWSLMAPLMLLWPFGLSSWARWNLLAVGEPRAGDFLFSFRLWIVIVRTLQPSFIKKIKLKIP